MQDLLGVVQTLRNMHDAMNYEIAGAKCLKIGLEKFQSDGFFMCALGCAVLGKIYEQPFLMYKCGSKFLHLN